MTWTRGRFLYGLTGQSFSTGYMCGENGMRLVKGEVGKRTRYTLSGSTLLRQSDGTDTLDFHYDGAGHAYGFDLNGIEYYYVRNAQQDITGIIDGTGTEVVHYTYDVWGLPLSITGSLATSVGEVNPLRYRGYYYDTETGYYYLRCVVGAFPLTGYFSPSSPSSPLPSSPSAPSAPWSAGSGLVAAGVVAALALFSGTASVPAFWPLT